jgi:hypothetical protein
MWHEVQVSLDGMEESHDALRSPGSFARARRGLEAAREAGLQISVASTVNALNLHDFDRLAALVEALDAWQWTIDVPCSAGRMAQRPRLEAPSAEAVKVLEHRFPSGTHGGTFHYLCGTTSPRSCPTAGWASAGSFPMKEAGESTMASRSRGGASPIARPNRSGRSVAPAASSRTAAAAAASEREALNHLHPTS